MTALVRDRDRQFFAQAFETTCQPMPESAMLFELSSDDSTRWRGVFERILDISLSQDGWDGQGAEAPHPGTVKRAFEIAHRLKEAGMPPADRVIATETGSVMCEWYCPTHYLEIEVIAPDSVEGREVDRSTGSVEEFTL